jgi:heme/copper-type cytochrome/quinol oxidase subunit 3
MSETVFIPAERKPPALNVSLGQTPKIGQDRTLLGVTVFIASESVFFLAIVLAYVAYRDSGLATAKATLDVGRTAMFSLALFASSGTMALAARARSRVWLAATMILGALFLVGQGTEYARLLGEGIGPGSALFGTTFFTLTGLHGLHVLAGLVALAALLAANLGRARAVSAVAWEAVGLYWHFVDAVWVVVFSVVYLGTLL